MDTQTPRAVLVCTSIRGIYFGYTTEDGRGDTIRLTNARHCFYFTEPTGPDNGVYSLATVGPLPGSKIGPRVSEQVIRHVANVSNVSPEAAANWEVAKWTK